MTRCPATIIIRPGLAPGHPFAYQHLEQGPQVRQCDKDEGHDDEHRWMILYSETAGWH